MKRAVTVALAADTVECLDHLALAEERSRSQVIDRALRQWLAAYLPPAGSDATPQPPEAA
jgi:predicted transcriptional regulator